MGTKARFNRKVKFNHLKIMWYQRGEVITQAYLINKSGKSLHDKSLELNDKILILFVILTQ